MSYHWFGICTCCGKLHILDERPDPYDFGYGYQLHDAKYAIRRQEIPCRKLSEKTEGRAGRWSYREVDNRCDGIVVQVPTDYRVLEPVFLVGGWEAVAAMWYDQGWDLIPKRGDECSWCHGTIREMYSQRARFEIHAEIPSFKEPFIEPRPGPRGRTRW